jgi:hypothetical protein
VVTQGTTLAYNYFDASEKKSIPSPLPQSRISWGNRAAQGLKQLDILVHPPLPRMLSSHEIHDLFLTRHRWAFENLQDTGDQLIRVIVCKDSSEPGARYQLILENSLFGHHREPTPQVIEDL